jgi:dTDP-glucose 4,6-dehydratase
MNGSAGETYNIGASNEIKNIEIANAVCLLLDELVTNKPNRINSFSDLITFVKDRPGHDQRYAINSSKAKSQLGWKANETFESGLRKTVKWYLDNEDWWTAILERDYSLSRIGKSE